MSDGHRTLLNTATQLAISAAQDKKLKSKAIKADIVLLQSHLDRITDLQEKARAARTIQALQAGHRRYKAHPDYASTLPPRTRS